MIQNAQTFGSSDNPAPTPDGDDPRINGSGIQPVYPRALYGSNVSRYKLMSPAKLPISRPPYLTIPPGLSPSSLLDSPVLLSNMKVEPSPTTGSFQKPQTMYGIIGSAVFLPPTNSSHNIQDERSGINFESKPLVSSSLGSNLSSARHLASAGSTSLQCEHFAKVQDEGQPQSLTSLPSVEIQQVTASSSDLEQPSSVNWVTLGTGLPTAKSLQNQVLDRLAQALHPDHREANPASITTEKSSDDGYNWRKYGQKLVKGSEFPRSYYKCTHPNCQVKKLFERSHDGRITEIIYKGRHDHPKPQPRRRFAVGTVLSITEENLNKFSLNSTEDKTSNAHGQTFYPSVLDGNSELPPVTPSDDEHDDDKDEDDPDSKRRKQELGVDVISLVKPTREPRVVVQTMSEVDILDDGYRWRKYGQKVVKGNPNPRSYYKCTNAGCPVRKHVERASHDPKAVITTYEGKHDHDVPVSRTSNHDKAETSMCTTYADADKAETSTCTTYADAVAGTTLEETDAVSLDLGVGIGITPENGLNKMTRRMEAVTQIHVGSSASMVFQVTPVSTYYGVHNDDDEQYEISANPGGNFRFETPTLNLSSNPYSQSMGSLLMGP